jgi:hypothetical protein
MKAIYPFVGGTASTHKWNLINPQDTDAAFRMVFNGGWTHSANGVQANGTNGFGDTKYSTLTNGNQTMMGVYTRNASIPSGSAFGLVDNIYQGTALAIKFSGDNFCYWAVNDNQSTDKFINNNTLSGFWSMGVNSLIWTTKVIYRNQTLIRSYSPIYNLQPPGNLSFSARNVAGTNNSYDNSQYAFFYIANVLSTAEIGNFYTAVQNFNTTLSRQVV